MTPTEFEQELEKLFPGCTDEDVDNLLWGATCFPAMGSDSEGLEYYLTQLKEGVEATDGSVSAVIDRAHKITEDAMREYNNKHKKELEECLPQSS